MMNIRRIVLVGEGWGAIAAYKGLEKLSIPLSTITEDAELQRLSCPMNDSLSDLENELIVFAGYKPIVPHLVLDKNVCINIHYSLLPKYRGFHSTVWAILNSEKYLGLSIHLMDEFIDNGPILHQYQVENDFKSTSTDYMQLFNMYIQNNIGDVIDSYIQGKIVPCMQNKRNASWVGKRNENDCKIDFKKSISYQKNFFRALVEPYPLPFFFHKGAKIIVKEVDFYSCDVETHLGRILNIDEEGVWVKIGDGYMILKKLLLEQNKVYEFSNFRIGQYLI